MHTEIMTIVYHYSQRATNVCTFYHWRHISFLIFPVRYSSHTPDPISPRKSNICFNTMFGQRAWKPSCDSTSRKLYNFRILVYGSKKKILSKREEGLALLYLHADLLCGAHLMNCLSTVFFHQKSLKIRCKVGSVIGAVTKDKYHFKMLHTKHCIILSPVMCHSIR